ncbi:MAG TPA: hypothetical protein VF715_13290 [Thermoleophilaceae bacterium]|jgi:hypothetical protein
MAGPSEVTFQVSTTSQQIPKFNTPPTVPKITMNGNPFPTPSRGIPTNSSGWQLIVLDSTSDLTNPANIRVNQYFPLFASDSGYWTQTYQWTYNSIGRFLLAAGNPETQFVILASYGWDNNAPPTSFMLQQLLNIGAGPLVQNWTMHSDAGSEVGWVSFPSAYVLIGGSSYQYGLGEEDFQFKGNSPVTAQASVTVHNN